MHRLLLNTSRLPCRVFPCSPHVKAFTCSEACLPPLPRSCVWCLSLLLWSCFALLRCSWSVRAPSLCTNLLPGILAPVTFVARPHDCSFPCLCRPLEARFQRRVKSLLANISIARPCGRSCVCVCSSEPCPSATPRATHSFFLNVVPTYFDTAVASPRLLPAPPFVEGSSPRDCLAHFAVHRECPAHFAVSPAVGDVPVRCAEQPTASPRTGPSVPWVSCRDPLG